MSMEVDQQAGSDSAPMSFEEVQRKLVSREHVPLQEYYRAFDAAKKACGGAAKARDSADVDSIGHVAKELTLTKPMPVKKTKPATDEWTNYTSLINHVEYHLDLAGAFDGLDEQDKAEVQSRKRELRIAAAREERTHFRTKRARYLQLMQSYDAQHNIRPQDPKKPSGVGRLLSYEMKNGKTRFILVHKADQTRGLKLKGSKYPKRSQRDDRQIVAIDRIMRFEEMAYGEQLWIDEWAMPADVDLSSDYNEMKGDPLLGRDIHRKNKERWMSRSYYDGLAKEALTLLYSDEYYYTD